MRTRFDLSTLLVTLASLFVSSQIRAECLSLIKGAIAFDVNSCRAVEPLRDLADANNEEFYKGMTVRDKQNFQKQYLGVVLNGKVVNSKAIRQGLSTERGALNGETITIFVKPGGPQCATLSAKRIAGVLDEVCCDGGADAPCLLKTGFVLNQVAVLGAPKSAAGDQKRQQIRHSEDYKKALVFLKEKKYKEGAQALEKVRLTNELDAGGQYWLAFSYRELDRCNQAIPVLKNIITENEKGKVWGDQLEFVPKANFLLARCLAKTGKPGESTLILYTFLIEPKRYHAEIVGSLKHPDFGWINATKEYQVYREKAKKVLEGKK